MSPVQKHFTAVVIGAGPGGYVAAIRLGQLGVKTAVIENGDLGGVCLNVGCIPSKALIEASKKISDLADSGREMGIRAKDVSLDVAQLQKWKTSVTHKLTSGVETLLKANGVEVIRGLASFLASNRLQVQLADGQMDVSADHIVVATGSRPIEIPGFPFDGTRVLSSTEALSIQEVPKRMLVIGGGYIGLELGGVYARFGTKVTIVELFSQVLPGLASDLVQPVTKALRKHGAELYTDTRALAFTAKDDGLHVDLSTKGGKTQKVVVDCILVTVGRRPNSDRLGLEKVGVNLDKRGFVVVDSMLRTSVPNVYAIGDVAGEPMLAHKASKEGEVVAEVIAGHPTKMDVRGIPAIIFTDPEIATVGDSEAAAVAKGISVRIGKFPFAANGRALTTGHADGFVRVVADAKSHEVLGVEIVGPNASDLIGEATLALEMGALSSDLGLTVAAHPSLPEAVMEAAKAVTGEAIHMINRAR
ncbi:MAG: dihydrolipoyl dehydrogenase [Myxococcales bacterium]|nr:dihydrolipoyl dehydrogenase [Myxococcales bacterium]